MRYKLLSGSHGRYESGTHVRYEPGDELELTEEQAARLGARVEPIPPAAAGQPKPETAPKPKPKAEPKAANPKGGRPPASPAGGVFS